MRYYITVSVSICFCFFIFAHVSLTQLDAIHHLPYKPRQINGRQARSIEQSVFH